MDAVPMGACPRTDHDGAHVPATRRITITDSSGSITYTLCAYCAEGDTHLALLNGRSVKIEPVVA